MSKNGQFLIEFLGKEVTKMLMEEYGWDLRKAMDAFLRSKTYAQVEDEGTGLYIQSPAYIFSILQDELNESKYGLPCIDV